MYFDNLHEAMNSPELHVLIPSTFTFDEAEIKAGNPDTNEVMELGKSATKEPRAYVFNIGGVRIRMIDTPGIGDSGAVEEDRKNIDNILSHLSHYDEIHAVCILLKSNISRLTTMFRYCIQETLVMLHSLVNDNVMFCFTNARGTFYKPGDTLPALNKVLRERSVGIRAIPQNYFCFDNEPFRFLSCVKNGFHFSPVEIDTYNNSWDKSVDEMTRLYEYINTQLKPHEVRETLCMNEARIIIVALSKPLAEVAKTINCNIQSCEDARNQIDLTDMDIKTLESDLKFFGYDIERVDLAYPRTVCTHNSCIKYVSVGKERVQNRVYDQICHDRCYCVHGIPTQTTNNPGLRRCVCIDKYSETCRKCGHHYTQHMHLTYDTKVVQKEFLSPEVRVAIQETKTTRAQKEAFKQLLDVKIKELREEEKVILRASAKYGSFLKATALLPYNDAVGDYLDMCIQQQVNKPKEIRDDSLLFKMREMKQEYERQRNVLDKAMRTGAGEIVTTPAQVRQLQEELFQLKHFGPILKRLFDGISITNSARNKDFAEKIVPIPPKCTSGKRNPKGMRWLFH